jgi:multicomponent Na+:H+ antiporter subunit D
VEEYVGIGKQMPKTLWCYTFSSLALIGIPPASGFVSKWYLAEGALEANVGIFGWLGPVVLLISALLTAGYLFPVTMKSFFPGKDVQVPEKSLEPKMGMLLPLAVLSLVSLLLGIIPGPLINYVSQIAATLM